MDLNRPPGGAFGRRIVLGLVLVLGGCTTGTPVAEKRAEEPCIRVHVGDCLAPEKFAESAAELAEAYRDEDEFQNRWELGHIKAALAYGNLRLLQGPAAEPGAGVTIGFLDSGIVTDHPAFAGKTVTQDFVEEPTADTSPVHGTAVASVAAGARSPAPGAVRGVAWGADIAMFTMNERSGPPLYAPLSLEEMVAVDSEMADGIEHALAWRDGDRKVDILNLSIGYPGLIDFYGEHVLRDNMSRSIAAMVQADAEEKAIFVWAAGNAHGLPCDPAAVDRCRHGRFNAVSPEVLAGLAAHIEELRGHSIAVAALSPSDGRLALFSNRCGIAADFCIAAPGERVRIAGGGIAYLDRSTGEPEVVYTVVEGDGTSYAAPMVSGGLAIMKQLFRDQLSNTELVRRLFETADKSGFYADSTLYGQGAMDLGAATSPVGVLAVVPGTQVDGLGIDLRTTGMRLGSAFGDGLRRSFAGRELVAFDRMGAPFWYRLDGFASAASGPATTGRLQDFLGTDSRGTPTQGIDLMGGSFQSGRGSVPWQLGVAARTLGARVSHLALAERTLTLTMAPRANLSVAAFTTEGGVGQRPVTGATLAWRPSGFPLGLRAGWIGERSTLLGGTARGAFGGLAAGTAFVGIEAEVVLEGWRLGVTAESGTVNPAASGGVIDDLSTMTTSTFTLQASRRFADAGFLRLSISQPLRVEQGHAALMVPVGRTKAGEVVHMPVTAGMAPSGRQLDVAVHWYQPLAMGEWRLGAAATHQPGHRATAGPALTLLSGWRWTF